MSSQAFDAARIPYDTTMQLLWMVLVLGVFLHDAYRASAGAWHVEMGWPGLVGLWLLPKIALACGYGWVCRWTLKQLGKRHPHHALRRQDLATLVFTLVLVCSYAVDLGLGVLTHIRGYIGDPVLIDELIVMLPVIGLMIFSWWASYPIDRRLREASIINRLDKHRPIYPIWTRSQFVISHLRHQTALILGPLLAIYGWVETVDWLGPPGLGWVSAAAIPWLTFGGALVVFLSAPLVIARLWDTTPLPAGDLRTRLEAMCRAHRVRVRQLLLWRTAGKGGGIVNAAVMGVIAPLRYILITDSLLDQVDQEEVEAVMAHELAHVRKHHMFWLIAAAAGGAAVLEFAVITLTNLLSASPEAGQGGHDEKVLVQAGSSLGSTVHALVGTLDHRTTILSLTAGVAALLWIIGFGWVSRRIERQADAFAVRHLAQQRQAGGSRVIDHDSAATMIHALEQVARLNHMRPSKNSWRHGSITWRQAYLHSLIGCPIDAMPIDRQMRWIKVASVAVIGVMVGAGWLLG